jgi:hypothetical protein
VATGRTEQYLEEGDYVDTEYDDEKHLEGEGKYELDEDRRDLRDADADQFLDAYHQGVQTKRRHKEMAWKGHAKTARRPKGKGKGTTKTERKMTSACADTAVGKTIGGNPEVKS